MDKYDIEYMKDFLTTTFMMKVKKVISRCLGINYEPINSKKLALVWLRLQIKHADNENDRTSYERVLHAVENADPYYGVDDLLLFFSKFDYELYTKYIDELTD